MNLLKESLFSLTQMLVMIPWGRAADHFGRKPILAISLIGMAMAASIFGLSKTVWQMMVFRCLAGLFAGTVV
jgi:MFS family permease